MSDFPNIQFINTDDPDLLAINERVNTWAGKFVHVKAGFFGLCPEHIAEVLDTELPIRVMKVDWTRDFVLVCWANLMEPWKPYAYWIATKWLEIAPAADAGTAAPLADDNAPHTEG